MISKEILQKIKHLHIKTNHLANEIFTGEYRSSFRGMGMEFEEVREYFPGDDVRSIDWNVTARTGKPHIKIFREERELNMMLLLDVSASAKFGSGERSKQEIFAEIAALLAFAAIKNNDKVGLMMFSDQVEYFIPPQKGKGHVFHVIKQILTYKPQHSKTDLNLALQTFTQWIKRRAICFVISDFLTDDFSKALKIAGKKHDVICTHVLDPYERELVQLGLLPVQDLETGEMVLLNTESKKVRDSYQQTMEKNLQELYRMFRSSGVDLISILDHQNYLDTILKFFRYREKHMY